MIQNLNSWMRPFITISFVGLVIYLTICGKIEADKILAPCGMLVSFWFGERAALKNKDSENN